MDCQPPLDSRQSQMFKVAMPQMLLSQEQVDPCVPRCIIARRASYSWAFCGMHSLLAMFPIWMGIFQIFFHKIIAVSWFCVLVRL